jgi:hypothetical protein
MNAIEVVDEIQKAVEEVKQIGRKTIRVTALEKYLAEFKVLAGSIESSKTGHNLTLAQYNAEWETSLAQFNAEHELGLEHAKVASQAGHFALKSAILINGGASVALLAFLDKLWESTTVHKALVMDMPLVLILFVMGVLSSAIAAGLNYLAACFGRQETEVRFHIFNGLTIAFVIGTLLGLRCRWVYRLLSFCSIHALTSSR